MSLLLIYKRSSPTFRKINSRNRTLPKIHYIYIVAPCLSISFPIVHAKGSLTRSTIIIELNSKVQTNSIIVSGVNQWWLLRLKFNYSPNSYIRSLLDSKSSNYDILPKSRYCLLLLVFPVHLISSVRRRWQDSPYLIIMFPCPFPVSLSLSLMTIWSDS